ncbi:MAG: tetratricopeptide repeat protein, partial [Candidatus Latescibacteria bacterium]|nr:tetratricopeptide repeat protein [Candidatus Latescibacterota bacterium]
QYLEKQPDDIAAWKLLGDEYKRLGRWDNALEAYRKILAIDSRDIQARCDMASVYLEQRKIDEAIREAGRALAIDSENAYANAMMGDAGQQWAMREYERRYPGREVEKMMFDFKTLMKKLADDYYEKAKRDPQWRTHAQNHINYLAQFFPQAQDRFMWPREKDHIIPFPPPQ